MSSVDCVMNETGPDAGAVQRYHSGAPPSSPPCSGSSTCRDAFAFDVVIEPEAPESGRAAAMSSFGGADAVESRHASWRCVPVEQQLPRATAISRVSPAVTPTRIILLGLAFDGVAGVVSAYLYGAGRPGLNSWGMAAGLVVTVALDLLLIPRLEETGAAIASAIAYTVTTTSLLWFFWRVKQSAAPPPSRAPHC